MFCRLNKEVNDESSVEARSVQVSSKPVLAPTKGNVLQSGTSRRERRLQQQQQHEDNVECR
jgi:hypothetical protein